MDKETLHRLLAHPTRTDLTKVEKEVARLNRVSEVLKIELGTWKDAVAARNETIEERNKDIIELQHRIDLLQETIDGDVKVSRKRHLDNAVRVEKLRMGVQATHSCVDVFAARLCELRDSLKKLEEEAHETRNHIAGDIAIDWMEKLNHELDDTDKK